MSTAVPELSPIEAAKRAAAYQAVAEHVHPSYRYVGIGSGSTIVYVVQAIAALGSAVTSQMTFIPTGDQSKGLIVDAGLKLGSIDALPLVGEKSGPSTRKLQTLDVAFDGADEVDDDLNLIKGGGACLFQEKLVAIQAKKFVCVADHRKLQSRLLTAWKGIPIEVAPLAAPAVLRVLITLGALDPQIRQGGSSKAGPVVTDNGYWIIDAPFPSLLLPSDLTEGQAGEGVNGAWEVHKLASKIKSIVGVLEVGIFHGRNGLEIAAAGEETGGEKPVAAYFGMADGTVQVRAAK